MSVHGQSPNLILNQNKCGFLRKQKEGEISGNNHDVPRGVVVIANVQLHLMESEFNSYVTI